jgi:hypothetical protein
MGYSRASGSSGSCNSKDTESNYGALKIVSQPFFGFGSVIIRTLSPV